MSNKYHAIRTNGFASKGEYSCYLMLKALEYAGEIRNIECQVSTELTAGIKHKTDFKIWDCKLGEPVWVEYKGFECQRWKMIKKLWKQHGPGKLQIFKGRGLRMVCVEEIIPNEYRK